MPLLTFIYDGSFDGLLHAVAAAVKSGETVAGIHTEQAYLPNLLDTVIRVRTDRQQAYRLFSYLKTLPENGVRFAVNGFLSEDPEVGLHLSRMVAACLTDGPAVVQRYSDDSIRYLHTLSRKVGLEAHRFNGLIRFRVLNNSIQYAPFEPDHNVIAFCAAHFCRRLRNQQWVLHDLRRNLALFWDGKKLQAVELDDRFTDHVRRRGEVPVEQMHDQEKYFQELWRSFHGTIANPQRENRCLQRQLMPRRYWKYLVEMKE